MAAKHTGAYGLHLGYTGWIQYPVTGTPANLGCSFWFRPNYAWAVADRAKFSVILETTGEHIGLVWNVITKTFDAYVDGGLVAAGTIYLADDEYFQVQFYAVIDNAGSINVKIGGQESIAYSGDTLPDGAAAAIEYVYFYSDGAATGVYFDDIVWGTGGYLGDCRVEWLAPNADTVVEDWTPSTGVDSYAVVDEIPPNTTDYLYTDTDAQETELELADWDDTDKTPLIVTAWARAYEDAATAESLKVGVDSGGVDDITEHIMTDTYQYWNHVMTQNPNGPAAWDNAAIDALKHRLESVI